MKEAILSFQITSRQAVGPTKGSFSKGKAGRGLNIIIHHDLVPSLKFPGVIFNFILYYKGVVIKKNPHWDYSSFPYSLKHLTLNCVF
jgi:hypothetical protein